MARTLSEHIEYLTLPGRNALYRQAIAARLQPGDLVADLGCGVGVLGLFCLEAGAEHCWGIDSSAAINLARESMMRAGLADRYTCLEEPTFNVDLPQKVDLIICDHVGFFGFDYGIVRLMRDARQRFLKPGGQMIPQSLDLMIAPVCSDEKRALAAKWSDAAVPEAYRWIEQLGRNTRYPTAFAADDLIGAPVRLGQIDFAEDEPGYFRFSGVLVASRAGRFDGFAGWFDCQLADDIRMTNSPLDPASIKRSQAFLPALESFDVAQGDEIAVSLRFRVDDDTFAWTIQPPGAALPHKLSTFNSTVLSPADLARDAGGPLTLTRHGAARAFVLAQVDGTRSREEIIATVLSQRPDLMPSEQAIHDFVTAVLAANCAA